jgi:hypothetical protein
LKIELEKECVAPRWRKNVLPQGTEARAIEEGVKKVTSPLEITREKEDGRAKGVISDESKQSGSVIGGELNLVNNGLLELDHMLVDGK